MFSNIALHQTNKNKCDIAQTLKRYIMNLLENPTTTKKLFATLAKGATDYKVSANGIDKRFENIKDAISSFDMICEMASGELTIISTSMQDSRIQLQFSYFLKEEISNMVSIVAMYY